MVLIPVFSSPTRIIIKSLYLHIDTFVVLLQPEPVYHIDTCVLSSLYLVDACFTSSHCILFCFSDNSPDSAWRQHWMDTKDAKSTLSRLPHDKKLSVEQQLLKSLASSKNDYCQAFSSVSLVKLTFSKVKILKCKDKL